ncbi:hypothetical protein [Salipiger mucosus]|uniref:Uncharacterized protein n=1 Tax=Salipiger mucosus DSM 16094 TaxID=1123237 RepID=S9QRR4_9RHOB|nr:hypothetical protein [Salipiger mucosus]EPX84076.1 hypothetical protein Salmuc_01851 [Salipiger mucosus DSM 16094]
MKKHLFSGVAVLVAVLGAPAIAADAEINEAWEGHKADDVCFAITFPEAERPGGDRYVTVSNRFEEGVEDEIAVVSGFGEEANIEGTIRIDEELPFQLLVYKGTGFLKTEELEEKAVQQMKAGRELEVKWTKPDGTYVFDEYSLYGMTASRAFANECD